MPRDVMQAMAVLLFSFGHPRLAVVLLVAFHCYLRTGEFLSLRVRGVLLDGARGAVRLDATKTSGRHAGIESVAIDDAMLRRLLGVVLAGLPADARICPVGPPEFRRLFRGLLVLLGIADLGFTPYSLRRGGATEDFFIHGSLDRCLFRGRWNSLQTARLYIQTGRALATRAALPPAARRRCADLATLLPFL